MRPSPHPYRGPFYKITEMSSLRGQITSLANGTENMQNNSNDYCGLFKSYYATEDEKTREQIDRKLRLLLLGSDRMAGYGVYFAENPVVVAGCNRSDRVNKLIY
jgi:hypothetical protein